MKRFTDTDKWRDSWFRSLSPQTKLAFEYIRDNCDISGVWDPDLALADFCIGTAVDWEKVRLELGDRLIVLESKKWCLTRFIPFQYGSLSEDSRPHAAVLRLVDTHGLSKVRGIQGVSKEHTKPQGQGQDKDKDRGGMGDMAETIYLAYPRKEAKQAALKAIIKAIGLTGYDVLLEKTRAYSDAVMRWPEAERRFVPHPATWFNRGSYDDDPSTWQRGVQDNMLPRLGVNL